MVDEIGVERVVAGHQHHQRLVPTAPGTAGLLPEGGPGAGEAGHDHGVQPGDVDAQLQRVRGRHAQEVTADQGGLQRPPLLRQVAAPVGRHPGHQRRLHLGEHPLRTERRQLRTATRTDEGQRARTFDDEVRQHPRRLRARGSPHRRAVLARQLVEQGRLPQRDGAARGGRPVVAHGHDLPPDEPCREGRRVRHRRGRQHDRRTRSVPGADPQQAAQQERHVRAEQPAVGVALVQHDVAQAAQIARPSGVPRQQRAVQHVRIAEQPPPVLAGPVPLGERGVAVVRRGTHVREVERCERPQLVRGERLGGREVQGGGPPVRGEGRQHRQLVGQRLPRRRAGRHHDVPAGVRQAGGPRLVAPGLPHAPLDEGRAHLGRHPVRPVDGASGPGRQVDGVPQRTVGLTGRAGFAPGEHAFQQPPGPAGTDAGTARPPTPVRSSRRGSHTPPTTRPTLVQGRPDLGHARIGCGRQVVVPAQPSAATAFVAITVCSARADGQPFVRGWRVSITTTKRSSGSTTPAVCR